MKAPSDQYLNQSSEFVDCDALDGMTDSEFQRVLELWWREHRPRVAVLSDKTFARWRAGHANAVRIDIGGVEPDGDSMFGGSYIIAADKLVHDPDFVARVIERSRR